MFQLNKTCCAYLLWTMCPWGVMQGTLIPRNICDYSDFRVQSRESLIEFYVMISFRGWCVMGVNNLFMVKCMVFMHRWCCRDHANYYMSKLQFDKYALLSRKGFCWEYALLSQNGFRCKYAPFWVCLVQTFTQTFRTWLRFCADIWTKNRRLASLMQAFSS